MDIFGKPAKKKTPFQNELDAKIKDRKARGLAHDLTETEDEDSPLASSDDDLLAAFSSMKPKKAERPTSESPWRAETETAPKPQPPKPQMRTSILESKQKQKIPIKPKNELDRLLADDDEDDAAEKKPWRPPQFRDLNAPADDNARKKPNPQQRESKGSPFMKNSPQQKSFIKEEEEGSEDEELAGAYTRQQQQRQQQQRQQQQQQRGSPFGRQTPTGGQGSVTPRNTKSPIQEKPRSGKSTPKAEDQLFGGKKPANDNSMDDIFGRRKSPSDQNLLGSKKNSKDVTGKEPNSKEFDSRRTPSSDLRKTPTSDAMSRESPTSQLFGRKSPKAGKESPQQSTMNDIFGAKKRAESPLFKSDQPRARPEDREGSLMRNDREQGKAQSGIKQQSTMNDIFGAKKRAESPLFKSDQPRARPEDREGSLMRNDREQGNAQSTFKKGSYMSSLLADSDEEKLPEASNSRTSYLDSLLGDKKDEPTSGTTKTRSSYLDNLLDDNKEGGRKSRTRERPNKMDSGDREEERESSICRDVDKDPIMIEQMKREREEKRQTQSGKAKTEGQQAEFDIEEVADAQNSLTMTYIKPEKPVAEKQRQQVGKPKSRRTSGSLGASPTTSTMSFENASDIRNYIYKEWSDKKLTVAKQNLKEKKIQEKELQLKKEKEEQDKRLENEQIFRTWKERKDEKLKERLRSMKLKEKQEKEEERKKLEKEQDAAKTFKMWKETKDEQIQENKSKQKKVEVSKLTEKQKLEAHKKKDAEGAFAGWKKKKDKEIVNTLRQTKVIVRQDMTQKMTDARRREIEAEKLYEKWLENKEKQKKRELSQAKSKRYTQESPRPAWSPANKTIPYRH